MRNARAIVKSGQAMVPEYLTKEKDLGTDSIKSSDVSIPYLKICQALSKIKQANSAIKDGQFYSSMGGEVLGGEISIYVLLHWTGQIWFKENKFHGRVYRSVDNKIVHQGPDIEDCLKGVYGDPMETQNYFVILTEEIKSAVATQRLPTLPFTLTLMSAGLKYAKQLNGKILSNAQSLHLPIYGQVVKAVTRLEKFSAGDAFMPVFSFPAEYPAPDEFLVLGKLHQSCRDLQSKVAENDGYEDAAS